MGLEREKPSADAAVGQAISGLWRPAWAGRPLPPPILRKVGRNKDLGVDLGTYERRRLHGKCFVSSESISAIYLLDISLYMESVQAFGWVQVVKDRAAKTAALGGVWRGARPTGLAPLNCFYCNRRVKCVAGTVQTLGRGKL